MTTLTYAGTMIRVLAVYPASRGFGYAVLEGPAELVDWGVKEARDNKSRRCQHQIRDLIERYRPMVLLIENHSVASGSRRCDRVKQLLRAIAAWATESVEVRQISRHAVKRTFTAAGAFSKDEIAHLIARHLPELGFRLPPDRKPWMNEDPRMSIFDAVALALTYYAEVGQGEIDVHSVPS